MGSMGDSDGLTARFNRLSFGGRNALRTASLTETLSGLVRRGTQERPWMYPVYMLYLLCLITPLPFPGVSTLLLLATAGYAAIPLLPGARSLRAHFSAAVQPGSLMERYAPYIVPARTAGESAVIQGWGLTKAVARKGFDDIRAATRHAINALK